MHEKHVFFYEFYNIVLSMQTAELGLRSPHGFKRFFTAMPPRSRTELSIRGLGLRERMPACMVERREGTGDYLLMLFHDRARVGTSLPLLHVPPDTLMIWPPNRSQYYGNRDHGFEHSWLHCSGNRIRRILAETRLPLGSPFPAPDVASFQQSLSDIHGELTMHLRPDLRIAGNVLENCLREFARMRESPKRSQVDGRLLAVRRIMDEVPGHKVSLSDLARTAAMAPSTFSANFRQVFGLSPAGYLIQCRMRRAAHLLSNCNLSVSEAATEVGYDDPFHFSKLFKKHMRSSPRDLRKGRESSSR